MLNLGPLVWALGFASCAKPHKHNNTLLKLKDMLDASTSMWRFCFDLALVVTVLFCGVYIYMKVQLKRETSSIHILNIDSRLLYCSCSQKLLYLTPVLYMNIWRL